jgi:hypothetical protein
VKDLKDLARRYFPNGMVDEDGAEIIIHTGLSVDPATGQLVSADMDDVDADDEDEPEFGRYRGD